MSKTVDFLHEAEVFYHATVDGAQAQVRPINSVMVYDGKIYFETSNKKAMYRQMLENPNIAVCGMAGSRWLRLPAKVVMDESDEVKRAIFEAIPALKEVYSYEELVPYYITDMNSVVYSFGTEPVVLDD